MHPHDFYLLSPEISMAGIAVLIVMADLFIEKKGLLAALSVLLLGIPLGFSAALWNTNETAFGGVLSVDNFALFFAYLFIAVAAAVIIASQDTVARFRRFAGEYYGLIL